MTSGRYPIDALLRPPVEWASTLAFSGVAALSYTAPSAFLMTPPVANGGAALLALFALVRFRQGLRVVRYQRGLRRLDAFTLSPRQIPHSTAWLYLGRGFAWGPTHTQRLWDVLRPGNHRYREPGALYRAARALEEAFPPLRALLSHPARLNPVRPWPTIGGLPALHGVGRPEGERDVRLPALERQGHVFYVGTTGVGKTRAAELAISQDIRAGYPVIVMDPKGDGDLFRRLYAEAKRAKRPFIFFHLGYPEQSARYNPIGRFTRITEVATRIANQLPSAGNAAAFRQFAWLFTHVISRALVALGQRPDYRAILRYMNNIEPLLIEYFEHWLDQQGPAGWREALKLEEGHKTIPHPLAARDARAVRLVAFYRDQELFDPVADGLKRAWEYEKSFFDKISVAVQPLLEKLLSGRVGELLNPDYADPNDTRPLLEWPAVIRRRAVVYCGFDALTDPEIAAVVGQSMVADLVAYAGEIYKHGVGQGLPDAEPTPETQVHLDEFGELARGPEIIQALNKGRGAGLRFSVYTQTLADLEAGLGDRAKAAQVAGNVTNTIVMLRVADLATAELLSNRLGKVEVNALTLVSGYTDSSIPESGVDFTANTQERIATQQVPLLEPGHLMKLPRGHAFILMQGAQLFKTRFPLIRDEARLPADLAAIARDMAKRYQSVPAAALSGYADDGVELAPGMAAFASQGASP